jgi:putative two-component system response regulator
MGGDITVESEYGSGSAFTAFIPQGIESDDPFAAVKEPEKKKVLVYEGRAVYAKSVCWSLENMRVPYTMVTDIEQFAAALKREEWSFVFSGYGLYEKIKLIMENTAFPNGKKPPLALMVEFGDEPYIPDVRFISLPVQSLSIANTLNGSLDNRNYFNAAGTGSRIRLTFPGARLLVVDDISTNLKVAEGLLAPYRATVDTCLSGTQAVGLVKQAAFKKCEYDIVFMDHMMPEMDGIETAAVIRSWEKQESNAGHKQIPIIALTANAITGMKEMFIEKGFNDFLAKPIDIGKLDEMLDRWIPKEKRASGVQNAMHPVIAREPDKDKIEDAKKYVIMVDDNPANLKLGKNILSEKYRVATFPSAQKMFSILENNHPDIILLDIDMPGMNGYEAIKILKSKPETKDIPVVFLTARTESDSELEGLSLGAIDYIIKPFQPSLLLKRIEVHLLVEAQRKELQYFNDNLQKMVEYKTESVIELQNALLKTIAELVECRDDITGGHIERTQRGISIMLEELEKSGVYREETKDWDMNLLLQSCQLHDVGKISIEDSILKKPGKLDEKEFEEMKKHTVFGERVIEKIETLAKESDFLKYAKIFAASHHEKWDGTGYPRRLKGNEIPLLGRVMAIADVYDALTSVRPYKKAFTHEEAVRIIAESSGTQFDPALVELFVQKSERFKSVFNSAE